MVDSRRVRCLNSKPILSGAVLYWMQRDQRVEDNWALLYAAQCAKEAKMPLIVAFNLVPSFGDASQRQYTCMFAGLREVEKSLHLIGVPFYVLAGQPADTIASFTEAHDIGQVVTDFYPLHFTTAWRTVVAKKISVRLTEVDAHNIIPIWEASPKLEYAAYTLRPKIHRLLPQFLKPFPKLKVEFQRNITLPIMIDWEQLLKTITANSHVLAVDWLVPGAQAAHKTLQEFIKERLAEYATKRNDPNANYLSNMSPYLHMGHISAQRVALEILNSDVQRSTKDIYLEELIVRRELADNFCFYNPDYDKVAGAHAWAQKTIAEHAKDTREFIYTRPEFETARTHDDLWNAAQRQMTSEGKMHGFMRMYWAKKILEWTPDAQTAIDTALYLNDKYELDGNDPNGVTGVMWSICGVHDRAWNERPIFGKIRYMNYAGCKRKFDIKAYIDKYSDTSAVETLFS